MKRSNSLLLAGTLALAATQASAGTFVYVSNAEDGDISAYTLSYDTGRLEPAPRTPAGGFVMPMTASADGRFLYASVRSKPFAVQTYRIDPASGALKWIGATPMPDSMVNMTLDRSGRWLLTASYGAHTMAVNAVGPDGRIAPDPATFVSTGGKNPHSLRMSLDNRFVVIPHLGTDEVRSYRFDPATGGLAFDPAASPQVPKNTGPRHSEASADGRFLYVLGEMAGNVTVYTRDAASGELKEVQTVSTQPADTRLIHGMQRAPAGPNAPPPPEGVDRMIWVADLHLTPDGRFLYSSERTASTLSRFAVEPGTGRLKLLGLTPTEQMPRGFAIDPDGRFLVASGEKSPTVSLYAIDPKTGDLALRQQVAAGKDANWVQIVRTR